MQDNHLNTNSPHHAEHAEHTGNTGNIENIANIATERIDIDSIMQEIRDEIQRKGFTEEMLDFSEIPFAQEAVPAETTFALSSLKQSAEYLQIRSQIEPYKPIGGNFVIRFVKKVLRKLMKFYILPIMTEQNALNLHTANSVSQLCAYLTAQETSGADKIDVTALAERMQMLELQQSVSQQELQALRSQVRVLQAENEQLRGRLS